MIEIVKDICPRCESPGRQLHPAVQHEGEVQICPHPWHAGETPQAQPATEQPSERLQFVAHEAGDGHVHIEVTFPGSTPRVLGTLKFLDYHDWDVLRRVLAKAGPSVTFVRYSRRVSGDVA